MFRSKPPFNVDQIARIQQTQLSLAWLFIVFEVALEVIKKPHLFLKFSRVIVEAIFLRDVFFGDSLDVVEVVLAKSEYLGGVIEIDSIALVIEQVADSVLAGVVDPLLDGYLLGELRHILVLLILGLLEDPLAFDSLDLLGLDWSLKATSVPFGIHEPILGFVLLQRELLAGNDIVIGVQLAIIAQLSVRLFVGRHFHKIAR